MTYRIVRKYRDMNHSDHNKQIASGLTLEEAQTHCNDPSTSEKGVWFDCYYEEDISSKPLPFMDTLFALQTKDPENYIYRRKRRGLA